MIREQMFDLARTYGERSARYYDPNRPGLPSQGDPVDGWRCHLLANAFRSLGLGMGLEDVVNILRSEWIKFATEQNKKVDAAPKLKKGPSAGHSVISGAYAYPGKIESDIIFVRNAYRMAQEGAA